MVNKILVVTILFLNFHLVFASAPAEEKLGIVPFEVSWEKNLAPLKIGWQGQASVNLLGKKKVSLERTKYPTQTLTLVVILKDIHLAPLVIEISDQSNSLHLNREMFKNISKEDFWFVGETPMSLCEGPASFSLRFLNKKELYIGVAGLFTWKLKKTDLPENSELYLLPQLLVDEPKVILSKVFVRADEGSKKKCQKYLGGICPFIFSVKPPSLGRTYQIHFRGQKHNKAQSGQCPV